MTSYFAKLHADNAIMYMHRFPTPTLETILKLTITFILSPSSYRQLSLPALDECGGGGRLSIVPLSLGSPVATGTATVRRCRKRRPKRHEPTSPACPSSPPGSASGGARGERILHWRHGQWSGERTTPPLAERVLQLSR